MVGADHHFVWSAWFLFCLLAVPLSSAQAQQGVPYIHSDADNRSWTIGNGLVSRKLTYSESTGLSTESWLHDTAGTDFIKQPFPANSPFGPPGAEFAFHVGVPVDVVSPQSRVYKEHPEWAIQDYLGNEKTAAFPGPHDRVMCLDSPYRKVAADDINRLIDAQHLAYLKLDLTSVFNAYGEAPGCHAKGHYHDNWAQSLEGIYECR